MSAAVVEDDLVVASGEAVSVAELAAAAERFGTLLDRFDTALVTGEEARRAAELLVVAERKVAGARLSATYRAADCGAFPRGDGSGDAADWAARLGGCGRGQAVSELCLADRLSGLAATRAAVESGEISLRQAREVALTASAVEGSEAEMLALAKRADLKSLTDRGRALRLRAIPPDELAERQRKARYHRTWVNELGMKCGSYALTPGEGVAAHNVLDAETDRRVRAEKIACNAAARRGELVERQPRERHAADALAAMLRGGGKPTSGRSEVVLVGDIRSLLANRDDVGEGCHLLGGGPVPVADVRRLLLEGDAFIKGVVHNGTDILAVQHFGRKLPAELRTALSLGSAPAFDGPVCSSDGCGRRWGLQLDHKQPVAAGGLGSAENLWWLCWLHHQEKTDADRAAGLLTPPNPGSERAPP